MKIIDELIPEPPGGAHRDPKRSAESLGRALRRHLAELRKLSPEALVEDRYARFRCLGAFTGK
jgi:acetyl-CoA carboxylase carboxyl transferase subunit alpha